MKLIAAKRAINKFLRVTGLARRFLLFQNCNAPILKEGWHVFKDCIYQGYWCGIYSSLEPFFLGEFCSYDYNSPEEIFQKAKNLKPNLKSIQIKYFIEGICETDGLIHTIIYECNVSNEKTWWTYGQEFRDIFRERRKVKIIPFSHRGKPIRWLAENGVCHNKHCGFILGRDKSGTQYFVLGEDG